MLRNKNVTFTFLLPKDGAFMIHQVFHPQRALFYTHSGCVE